MGVYNVTTLDRHNMIYVERTTKLNTQCFARGESTVGGQW